MFDAVEFVGTEDETVDAAGCGEDCPAGAMERVFKGKVWEGEGGAEEEGGGEGEEGTWTDSVLCGGQR